MVLVRVIRAVVRAIRVPLRRPLEPLLWIAASLSAKDVWTLPGSHGDAGASPSSRSRKPTSARRRRGGTLLVVAAQSQLDGARWQVYPAYMSAVACTAVEYLAGAGVDVHPIICKLVAFSGGIGALVSTAAGVFAPVFLMPKPTGPYRTGKTTRLWIDGTRRSWLLRSKGRSLGKIPESRMLMANVWYPAAAPKPQLRRDAAVKKKKETSSSDSDSESSRSPSPRRKSSKDKDSKRKKRRSSSSSSD